MKLSKTPVNQVSLDRVYSGPALHLIEWKWVVVSPDGTQDDTHYKSRQDAWNSLCESDDILDYVRHIFSEEKWDSDESAIQDYAITNITELAEQVGYRVNRI